MVVNLPLTPQFSTALLRLASMNEKHSPADEKHLEEHSNLAHRDPDLPPAYPLSPSGSGSESTQPFSTISKSSPSQSFSYARLPFSRSDNSSRTRPAQKYAAVSLAWDRIRMIGFPEDVRLPVDGAIKRTWTSGVKDFRVEAEGTCYWKLAGWPWEPAGGRTVRARRMIAHILHALAGKGWHLAVSTDLGRPHHVQDTLIFRLGEPAQKYVFSVSLHGSDKIRLIDAPDDGVRVAFELAVKKIWLRGLQESREEEPGAWQLKLRGTPWTVESGDQFDSARKVMLGVLAAMETEGYRLLGGVAMTSASEHTTGYTWFFVQM